MNLTLHVLSALLLACLVGLHTAAQEQPPAAEPEMPFAIGGTGGAYFLAEPGPLVVDVQKRDLNRRGRRAELRAILVGPDREVLDEVTLPDDGQPRGSGPGPVQQARLSTQVERKGVFGLNITVSQDRYGEEIAWAFTTNCPRWLIETARGHKDEAHREPIVLLGPDRPSDVCFLPRRGPFGVEVTGLPKGADDLDVFDAEGTLVKTLRPDASGRASATLPGEVHRDAVPWRLHLPVQRGTVEIDGVTRWDAGDLYPNLACWTPRAPSFFPLLKYRWILTPYHRTVYGKPGERGEIAFQVHNNSPGETTVDLALEFPDAEWPVELSTGRVVLASKRSQEVVLRYEAPAEAQTRVCHLRATPTDDPSFTTYSTLTVKAGTAPAAKSLDVPIVLKPYRHENEQWGYLPDYPTESQVYFDPENRPFVRTGAGLATWRDGTWATCELRTAVRSRVPPFEGTSFGVPCSKVAFDRDGDVYLLATAGSRAALLHSADGGKTFAAYVIPGREGGHRAWDIGQFSGHNLAEGPPPVLRYTQTARDPRLIWRRINDLELFLPRKTGGRLELGEPVLVSRKCIGLAAHSGIPSTVVSRGSKVHVVWAEATDPSAGVPGVPTYVATYDRQSRTLGEPALVGYGPPANDVHNTPSITMDSRGYLHVLAGTHGRPFPYARSLKPNDAHGGWTEAVLTGEGLPQTYIGLVCGPDDTLHAAMRLWRHGAEPFPASHHGTLAYQRKRPGEPWEAPRVLIVPPFSEYSVYYHRLTIDRRGRLFLSYDYWSTYWFYRNDHRGSRRALLMSEDGGDTWRLADTAALVPGSE